jgi:hypothetical protein
MKTYTIKLAKTIVVEVEAESVAEAKHKALEYNTGWYDGAWEKAKTTVEYLAQEIEGVGKTYKVIRHYKTAPNKVIKTGLTLAEAKDWCRRDDTHGDGWFDGYDEE